LASLLFNSDFESRSHPHKFGSIAEPDPRPYFLIPYLYQYPVGTVPIFWRIKSISVNYHQNTFSTGTHPCCFFWGVGGCSKYCKGSTGTVTVHYNIT
jgi:hypothetical protein